jgi:hypothetical protein
VTGPRFTTFTLFPKLPLELRTIIWNLVEPNPRTIYVDFRDGYAPTAQPPLFTCSKRPTSLLNVNKESRAVALKQHIRAGWYSEIYINLASDTLCFRSVQEFAKFHNIMTTTHKQQSGLLQWSDLEENLRHITIDKHDRYVFWFHRVADRTELLAPLLKFQNLHTLVLNGFYAAHGSGEDFMSLAKSLVNQQWEFDTTFNLVLHEDANTPGHEIYQITCSCNDPGSIRKL